MTPAVKPNRAKIHVLVAWCLIFGQMCAVGPGFAESGVPTPAQGIIAERSAPIASLRASNEDYRTVFDLAFRVMSHKFFYSYLNETFAASVLSPRNQRAAGLALPQVVFILLHAKEKWPEIERYLGAMRTDAHQDDEALALRARFRSVFDEFTRDARLLEKLRDQNDPTQPLEISAERGALGFSSLKMFVNHPTLTSPEDPKSRERPPDDLHQLVIDFINGAKKEIWLNVFDFDSLEIAAALTAASARGAAVHAGIDVGVFKERPEVQSVVAKLTGLSVETVLRRIAELPSENATIASRAHAGLKVTLVNSVGLNHQKAIVRDVMAKKNAATLLLSGNLTYSCIHENGDAAVLPHDLRPAEAKPNANHAVLIEGQLPAIIVEQELRKTLDYGIRGQSRYPLGGAFRVLGPRDPETKRPTSIILTFSPNGGLGDINRDILARLLRATRGPVVSAQFAFSSASLVSEIVARTVSEQRKGTREPFRAVGDPPFAMREWSAFLALSGYSRDVATKTYNDLATDPGAAVAPLVRTMSGREFEEWRESIRIGSTRFSDRYVTLPGDRKFKISAKLHHKFWAFPEERTSVVGTSFNPSQNAENNNEQILIVNDSRLLRKAMGMFEYLFREARSSVAAEAVRRNDFPAKTPAEPETAFEKRLKAEGAKNNRCPLLFAEGKAG